MDGTRTGESAGLPPGPAPVRLTVVVARAQNGVIGRDGGLPWHLPDDLRRFRELTWGRPILMGRSTHESIGRALPGRRNLVLSRQPGYTGSEGVEVFHDLDAALAACAGVPRTDNGGTGSGERAPPVGRASARQEEVMVIGGAALYDATLRLADRLLLTEVHAEVEGDTLLPPLDLSGFERVAEWHHPADERHAYAFTLGDWHRR